MKSRSLFNKKIFYINFNFVQGTGGLTAYEKQAIVDAHNRLRQSVALGQVSSQPPAANMMEMVCKNHTLSHYLVRFIT